MEANLIHAAHASDVQQLLFLGSSCIYPKHAAQPIREEALLTGPLEPTNEPYAIAKIAGIKLCESHNRQYGRDYRSVMPTNLYGPGDNFHPTDSHVIPGLMRRFHEATANGDPQVVVWGTGQVRREFLHVDDLARACLRVMETPHHEYAAVTEPMRSHLNVGASDDITIRELAEQIAAVTGFEGELVFDTSKPDGTRQKLLDTQRINGLGWWPSIDFMKGLAMTYEWFRKAERVKR
jgi:nucleoside-diphosphate-sugar epimerase